MPHTHCTSTVNKSMTIRRETEHAADMSSDTSVVNGVENARWKVAATICFKAM